MRLDERFTAAFAPPPERASLGTRVHVLGNCCAGKSTLAARLAEALDAPLIELDALNWLPGWTSLRDTDRAAFEARVATACAGERWAVAGSCQGTALKLIWPRVQTVIWLDLPRSRLVLRVLVRSWRRWRSRELLWGTVRERFWSVLMVWRGEESLLWWIWTRHARKRRDVAAMVRDPRWASVRFVRFESTAAANRWVATLAGPSRTGGPPT